MEYLILEIIFFVAAYIFHRTRKIKLFESTRQMIVFYAIALVAGTIWDTVAIYRNHWIYSSDKLIGLTIGLMPFEDYLFIIIVLYCSLLVYKEVMQKRKTKL